MFPLPIDAIGEIWKIFRLTASEEMSFETVDGRTDAGYLYSVITGAYDALGRYLCAIHFYNFNETLTNGVVDFEQPAPVCHILKSGFKWAKYLIIQNQQI